MVPRCVLAEALCIAFCSCISMPTPFDAVAPTVGYPFDREALVRDDVAACSAQLNALSWYGTVPWERAAFLHLNGDGSFRCDLWPAEHRHRSASWRGPIPAGTAAIIHTHTRGDREPSQQDSTDACRFGIPVIAVTIDSVAMALPCKTDVVRAPLAPRLQFASH